MLRNEHLPLLSIPSELNRNDCPMSEADLVHPSRLTALCQLDLSVASARVTGPGVAHLVGLTHLEHLDPSNTDLMEKGRELLGRMAQFEEHLRGLVHRETLVLIPRRAITDDGLEHRHDLPGRDRSTSRKLRPRK